MTDVYIATFLLAATFLLICWVVSEYQIYTDTHSMEEMLGKPRMSSRIRTWQIMFWDTMHSLRHFRQERLKEENRNLFLFGQESRDKRDRMDERAERTKERQGTRDKNFERRAAVR